VQIGSWKNQDSDWDIGILKDVLCNVIKQTISKCEFPGILLSGGVDSSILAIIANSYRDIPCFTIGSSHNHPDVVASCKLADLYQFEHYVYIPPVAIIQRVKESNNFKFPGDECVYIALQFASHFVSDVISGDGIDEQMGGYWWHANKCDDYASTEKAFEHFWNVLESDHLSPMFESASSIGVNLWWPFLHEVIIDYINRIPLRDRVEGGVSKYIWKKLAASSGVPEYIIDRPKQGFIGALTEVQKVKRGRL